MTVDRNRADSELTLGALDVHRRGQHPITLYRKQPNTEGWSRRTFADDRDVIRDFTSVTADCGLGVRLGDLGLANIDPDSPAARRAAPLLLPPTAMRSGAGDAPSAWWYRVIDLGDGFYLKHTGPDGESVVEVRGSTGHQTAIPPTVHPDSGEPYRWHDQPWGGSEGPAEVTLTRFRAAGAEVALAALLSEVWPTAAGTRHETCLALVGSLLRGGEDNGELVGAVGRVVMAVSTLTGDRETRVRVREAVPSTVARLRKGDRAVTGWPKLRDLLGPSAAATLDSVDRAAAELRDALGVSEWIVPEVGEVGEDSVDPAARLMADVGRCRRHPAIDWQCEDCLDRRKAVEDTVARRRAIRAGGTEVTLATLGDIDPDKIEDDPRTIGVFAADGRAVFADGEVNGIHGQPGSGKTWIGDLVLLEQARLGRLGLLLDYELRLPKVIKRLAHLRSTQAERERIAYTNPTSAFSDVEKARLVRHVADRAVAAGLPPDTGPSAVVVDSTGQGMGHSGLNQNHDDEVVAWMGMVVDWVREQWPGVTVILIDHLPKDSNSLMPIGSQRKQAAVMCQFLVRTVEPWSKHQAGHSEIVCGKDNTGDFTVGEVVARLYGGPAEIRLGETRPEDNAPRNAAEVQRGREQVEELLRDDRTGPSMRTMLAATRPDGSRWITVSEAVAGKAVKEMEKGGLLRVDKVGGRAGNRHYLTDKALASPAPIVVVNLDRAPGWVKGD